MVCAHIVLFSRCLCVHFYFSIEYTQLDAIPNNIRVMSTTEWKCESSRVTRGAPILIVETALLMFSLVGSEEILGYYNLWHRRSDSAWQGLRIQHISYISRVFLISSEEQTSVSNYFRQWSNCRKRLPYQEKDTWLLKRVVYMQKTNKQKSTYFK